MWVDVHVCMLRMRCFVRAQEVCFGIFLRFYGREETVGRDMGQARQPRSRNQEVFSSHHTQMVGEVFRSHKQDTPR